MRIITGTTDYRIEEASALAIGKFDGLHRGHEKLLQVLREKKTEGLLSVCFTFQTPPMHEGQKELSPGREKEELFRSAGIDVLIECPFTEEVRTLPPEDFLRRLKSQLQVRCIAAGGDCRFGYKRRGDAGLLREYGELLGYEAVIVEKEMWQEKEISSTLIREKIEEGELDIARELLGYPYFISGTIAHGNRIGHEIGVPTINLLPPEDKLLPPFGVYASETALDGKRIRGITNIGRKPTVGEDSPVSAETHLFGFDRDVYEEEARVSLLSFLRPEKKFASLAELKAAIEKDRERAEQFFKEI